jgi:PhnB protein
MTQIFAYLTFNGNCCEAMEFYKECLGGKLTLQTRGDSPMAERMPEQMKNHILPATLKKGNLVLMGSDMAGDNGLKTGSAVSLMLDCENEEEIRSCYKKLSAGGQATHQLEHTFWGALFGDLTDKYGNQWLFNYNKKQQP